MLIKGADMMIKENKVKRVKNTKAYANQVNAWVKEKEKDYARTLAFMRYPLSKAQSLPPPVEVG